jgi:putative DNA primase/helicase
MMSTVDRARNLWPEILPMLGVDARFLTGRHGPCPMCGGKDRFRFTDRNGEGWYYCNQCGPGSGILLLRRLHGWDHAEACRQVDRLLGAEQRRQSIERPSRSDTAKLAAVHNLIAGATAPAIVNGYLQSRGIAVSSPVLVGHPACPYFNEHRSLIGRFPAVVAPVLAPDGQLVCAHRIYLADVEPRKKNTEVAGTVKGAAARLHEVEDEMGIGEGIETCLSAHQIFDMPMWAALTAYGVETFEPPASLRRLHIFGDNDSNFTGQRAAFALANRLARTLEVFVNIPEEPDTDWNDVLHKQLPR